MTAQAQQKPYRLKLVATAAGVYLTCSGKYVKSYDVAYVHPYGYDGGLLEMTTKPEEAMAFATAAEAFALWRATAPPPFNKRADGEPNRPLTAFTVEVSQV
jgi:hypothetical protein